MDDLRLVIGEGAEVNTPAWKRLPTKLPTTRGSILIRDWDMNPLFVLDIWGVTPRDLCMCPGGGNIVADALRRRGIDPESVYFTIWDVGLD